MSDYRTTPDHGGACLLVSPRNFGFLAVTRLTGGYDDGTAFVRLSDRLPLAAAVAGPEYVVVRREDAVEAANLAGAVGAPLHPLRDRLRAAMDGTL